MSANDNELDADRKAVLDQLSPEERAALEEDEHSPEEQARLKALAGDDGDQDDDDDDDDDDDAGTGGDGSAAGEAKPAAKPDAKPDDDAGADADATGATIPDGDDDSSPFKATYDASLPEDFEDKVKALDDAEADLAAKFKEGDVDADEFLAEQRRISRERNDLQAIKTKAETFAAMNEQSARQEWQWTIKRFIRTTKQAGGIDYEGDTAKFADFDTFVKMVASKPENANKSYDWFLAEADKMTRAMHGIAAPAPKKDEKPGKPAARKPPLENLPKNLAGVAGGEGPGDVGNDEFSDLDNLTGLEYETALAKLSPEQRDRYRATA